MTGVDTGQELFMDFQIRFSGVSHRYGANSEVRATDDVDLDIKQGEFVALIGPSGCGKTTLLNMVAGLVCPSDGQVLLDGRSIGTSVPDGLGYMMARDALMPWRTAQKNVEFSLEPLGLSRSERADRAAAALEQVRLAGFEHHYPSQLSQGMKQRVAIARTLVAEPKIVLMDEPFAALDAQTRVLLHEQFLELWEATRSTVILVTHDLNEAILLADRVVIMSARPGRIKRDIHVDLPRPRDIERLQVSTEYQAIYGQLWDSLREEFQLDAARRS